MTVHESQLGYASVDLVEYLRGRPDEIAVAYRETERLLRNRAMLSNHKEFRKAVKLMTRQTLMDVIKEIAEHGLIASDGRKNEQVDPNDLQEILEDEELTHSLHFAVRCSKESGNSHWHDSGLDDLLNNDDMISTTSSGEIKAKWKEESPEDDTVAGRVSDKVSAKHDTSSANGGAPTRDRQAERGKTREALASYPKDPARPSSKNRIWWSVAASVAAVAAGLLIGITLRPSQITPLGNAPPRFAEVVEASSPPYRVSASQDQLTFATDIDQSVIQTVLLRLGPRPSDVHRVYHVDTHPAATPTIRPLTWTKQMKLADLREPQFIRPVVEYVPFSDVATNYGLRNQVIPAESLFAITPQGIVEQKLDELNDMLRDLGLDQPFRFEDPNYFRVEGVDRIAAVLEVNPHLCREVTVSWGPDTERLELQRDVLQHNVTLQKIKARSPKLDARGGFSHFVAKISVTLDPIVRERLPAFLFQETYEFERKFLLTPLGIIPDASPPVATLDTITNLGKESSHRYRLSGIALPQPDSETFGLILIEPLESENSFVGAVFSLSDDGRFSVRCHLGTNVDNQGYNLWAIIPKRVNVKKFAPLDQIEPDFAWDAEGFIKTGMRFKENDGTDGFDTP